ncbi:hypothetical protein ACFLQL_03095 [Verrucomicrobiota bacterium]
MKRRFGFVSNSSSSSFCVFGVTIPAWHEEEDYDEMDDRLEKLLKFTGLSYSIGEEHYLHVGGAPQDMNDDETVKEFKKRIIKNLKTCFPQIKVKDIKWQSEIVSTG